uniref:Uncharacterized protein n=1 Tax=Anguilla anguilla TaxID=7936 RepID=A0A0E9XCW9_ANGAN
MEGQLTQAHADSLWVGKKRPWDVSSKDSVQHVVLRTPFCDHVEKHLRTRQEAHRAGFPFNINL